MKLPSYRIVSTQARTMTATELAELYGCHRSHVYKTAAAQGWNFVRESWRKMPTAAEIKAIVKAEPSITAADFKARYGVSDTTVSLACKDAGIKLRRVPYPRRRSQELRS